MLIENDELADIEQSGFMNRSKLMLSMIDNMLATIDNRIAQVSPLKAHETAAVAS
jgi:hypothetical protein